MERDEGSGVWSPAIGWSIGSMDFDNPKVYGDTSIADGLVFCEQEARNPLKFFCLNLKGTKDEKGPGRAR